MNEPTPAACEWVAVREQTSVWLAVSFHFNAQIWKVHTGLFVLSRGHAASVCSFILSSLRRTLFFSGLV